MSRGRRLAASLAILILTALAGAVGFVLLEGASIGDALYVTVLTISTVGFNEVSLGVGGRVLTTVLIVVGVGVALYTAGTALEIALERFLGGEVRRKRMATAIDKLDKHVIVAGFGRVGSYTW